jgi:hypothetical protein
MDPYERDFRSSGDPVVDQKLMDLRNSAAGKTVKISTTVQGLTGMVSGDEFKTGHRVASRIAAVNHINPERYMRRRTDYEKQAFKGSEPAYGYIATARNGGVNIAYGSVTIVLNDKAKNRTTVTFGDSLDEKPAVVWATDVPSMTIGSMRQSMTTWHQSPKYVETQTHGGLIPSRDFARVIVKPPDAAKMTSTIAKLREMGVEVLVESSTAKRKAAMEEPAAPAPSALIAAAVEEQDGFDDEALAKAVADASPATDEDFVTMPDGSEVPFERVIALTNGLALEWLPIEPLYDRALDPATDGA